MTWLRRRAVAIAATVVAVNGCVGGERADRTSEVEVSQQRTSSPDDIAAAAFTRSQFADLRADDPGCTVAVGRDGVVVFAEAYGAARLNPLEPMTVDTVVDIGSVSKQFTATAILLLAERGLIDLDAPLSTYLPDLPAWAVRPTLRQLMHQQSGIPQYNELLLDRGFSVDGPATEADTLAVLGSVTELHFAPGTSNEYSNSNYFLLGQVVREVTGQGLGEFLAAEVFEPLGLEMVMDPIAAIENKAVSYDHDDDGQWQAIHSGWEQLGPGGIQTTPSQLVTWAAQYWEPTIGASTIGAERFEAAADLGGGARYGAGILERHVNTRLGRMLSHDGAWEAFVSIFAVAPTQRVAVAVTCSRADWLDRLTEHRLDIDLLTAWIGTD